MSFSERIPTSFHYSISELEEKEDYFKYIKAPSEPTSNHINHFFEEFDFDQTLPSKKI